MATSFRLLHGSLTQTRTPTADALPSIIRQQGPGSRQHLPGRQGQHLLAAFPFSQDVPSTKPPAGSGPAMNRQPQQTFLSRRPLPASRLAMAAALLTATAFVRP